jgi:hypothetical protein
LANSSGGSSDQSISQTRNNGNIDLPLSQPIYTIARRIILKTLLVHKKTNSEKVATEQVTEAVREDKGYIPHDKSIVFPGFVSREVDLGQSTNLGSGISLTTAHECESLLATAPNSASKMGIESGEYDM